jgi:dihydrofolate reductase
MRTTSQSSPGVPVALPRVSLIVAMAADRVIGVDNALPWRLPDDLKRFKAVTLGKPVLMGRRTFESIGRPLPGRLNIVLTRNPDFRVAGVVAVPSWAAALQAAGDAPELMVIGGALLYTQALPLAQRIYLTEVHAQVPGDAQFPEFAAAEWQEIEREEHPADERHAFAMTFRLLERAA